MEASGVNTSNALGPKRQMEWESPWGTGFPGWHIECSAMSLEALTDFFEKESHSRGERSRTIDIHTGGIDHIAIHHSNEIAQSEAATGEKFVNYWIHHNFLVVNGEKMSKSLGNFYTVQDVIDKGYDPLSLRYLYLQTHYRQEMNFTWESLDAAQTAYTKLTTIIQNLVRDLVSQEKKQEIGCAEFEEHFMNSLNDDLNTPKALAIIWELIKSDYPASAKVASMRKFDSLLGLKLFDKSSTQQEVDIPKEVKDFILEREAFRKAGDFSTADELRKTIEEKGFSISDTKDGPKIEKIHG